MEDSQHHYAVELSFGPIEQTDALAVLPPHRRGWTGKIRNDGENGETAPVRGLPIEIGGLNIGIPSHHIGAAFNSDARINTGIGAYIEHAGRPNALQGGADKRLLGLLVRRLVVGGSLGVTAPSRGTRG